MPDIADLLSRNASRSGEQRKRLQAPFQGARFHPSGMQSDARLGDQNEQGIGADCVVRGAATRLPGDPDLHGGFEAELARNL